MLQKPVAKRVTKPKRPAHLPYGRWLGDFEPLSPFERKLVTACARGEICEPDNWDGKRPEADAASNANIVRAELIRFLAVGGDEENPVHEAGVMLGGAWIKNKLSLHQTMAMVQLDLRFCHFDSKPVFTKASLPDLSLIGSKVPGLQADGMVVKGSVVLREGFEATDEVRLPGAQIGGNLSCIKSKFSNRGGYALIADGIVVKGRVFLSAGFEANGEVRLLSAQIANGLECDNSKFNNPDGVALDAGGIVVESSVYLRKGFEAKGEVRLIGAQIDGNLECHNSKFSNLEGSALSADGLVVKRFVFLHYTTIQGAINLATARIGTLADDIACWQAGGHLLDGLHYDRIIGPTDAAMRIGWLMKQAENELGKGFAPQPWEQLIKVLREMGHPYEAAQVAIAKQEQLRKAGKIEGPVRNAMHWLYGKLAGYGHRPIWTVYWMAAVCVLCSLGYYGGRELGVVGPSSPLIHASARFDSCGARGEAGKHYWTSTNCPMPPEYTTFQPFIYSLDLILPLVELQQDSDWAPIVSNTNGETLWAGRALRLLMWFEILFGWMASLTLVAVLGRLVDKD
jgi:hypothetical protein